MEITRQAPTGVTVCYYFLKEIKLVGSIGSPHNERYEGTVLAEVTNVSRSEIVVGIANTISSINGACAHLLGTRVPCWQKSPKSEVVVGIAYTFSSMNCTRAHL